MRIKEKTKAIKEHRKQLFESNKLIEKDFNIKRDSTPPEQKEIINELLEERSSEFRILEKIVLII